MRPINIYIRIEVLSRELQGRLLLALVAAERGHRVVLGKHNAGRVLGNEDSPGYPPGLFHDKSLGYDDPKTEMKKTLIARGWGITAQDEEHGLVTEVFGENMLDRFLDEGFDYNHLLFAWGDFDSEALHLLRSSRRDQIVRTGSPRADLWRPDMAAVHGREQVHEVTAGRPFVLINPIGGWNPGAPERVFGLDGTPADEERIASLSRSLRLMSRFVAAADALAREHPDLLIILRPHPGAELDVWVKAADRCHEHVIVSREARLTPWLQEAIAVVTNGSTVAFEALLAGTPLITFAPDGELAYDAVTHRIGRIATDLDQLSRAIEDASEKTTREQWFSTQMVDAVRHRFAALDGRLAADRIVDEWDRLDERLDLASAEPWTARVLERRTGTGGRRLRTLLKRARATSAEPEAPEPVRDDQTPSAKPKPRWIAPRETFQEKFPPFDPEDIRRFHQGLSRATGRFSNVRIELQHDRLLLVTRED